MARFLIAGLAACAVAILLGWQRIQSQAKDLTTAHNQIRILNAAAASRRNTQRLLADLDTQHTQDLTNAQAENAALRARVATGDQRLSVKARCPVRPATGATGVDDAEARAELDPAAAERIVTIANDGDDAIRALTGLQDSVNTVCLAK